MAAVVKVEDVVLPLQTPLQRLAALKAQVDDFDSEIKNAEIIFGIKQLREHRDLRNKEYLQLLDEVSGQVTFTEDKFLEAIGKKGESYKEGKLKLVRMTRVTREVRSQEFAAAFPEIALKILKIEVGKAEKKIGTEALDKYCNKKVAYSYELFDLEKLAKIGE